MLKHISVLAAYNCSYFTLLSQYLALNNWFMALAQCSATDPTLYFHLWLCLSSSCHVWQAIQNLWLVCVCVCCFSSPGVHSLTGVQTSPRQESARMAVLFFVMQVGSLTHCCSEQQAHLSCGMVSGFIENPMKLDVQVVFFVWPACVFSPSWFFFHSSVSYWVSQLACQIWES